MLPKIDPTTTKSWARLLELSTQKFNIQDSINSERIKKYTFDFGDFHFDFSKNMVSDEVLKNLIHLAEECQVNDATKSMFNGEQINETEDRAVHHIALRERSKPEVRKELEKTKVFTEKLHNGEWRGFSGKKITDVVNIGIGGSDLGPKMVSYALRPFWKDITPHFISNVDAAQQVEILDDLNPETTLFIIASKTFTTQETLTNAFSAREWFLTKGGNEQTISKHFVAVSTNESAVNDFGISSENMFEFWDWVGGRYSLWSAIGLSIACAVGFKQFEELLDGAKEMDDHFHTTEPSKNLPTLSALIGVWYNNFLEYDSLAILPYDHRLRYLPSYLQQVDMESNGKYIDRSGKKANYQTGPIIWGEPGTNGQHAFYQLIHQGTKVIPCEFIAVSKPAHNHQDHHEKLLANFFAQSEALLTGKTREQVISEIGNQADELVISSKVFEGNRPSTSILFKELNPFNLGKLIAFYEHKVFVQGVIWNIFSFDQWGVELGKQLSKPILREIKEQTEGKHDSSTQSLMRKFYDMRK
ncbi:glucose-6-phosphate isomerase [Ekhidna lutea]|uniref:Glucose-6-phosphate isomerase n=1 Tax=Ekhidna lutea TaxID=447679 RepID=A0A239M717_EKHLU|nr:glucose-6-phosphate isomerase [Ekhidna lutea]SNT38717.1 glucose-6-phosphate isomerase [Ekhidna lutea]